MLIIAMMAACSPIRPIALSVKIANFVMNAWTASPVTIQIFPRIALIAAI